MGAENLAPPTGIRSPDRPARSDSLHRLSYTGTDRNYEKSSRRIADMEYQFDFRRQDSDAKHANWQKDPPERVKCYTDHSFSHAGYTHTNT
jgi:hypothetical protein